MAIASDNILIARNPATGAELGRIEPTPAQSVADIIERAREAQREWATTSWSTRRALLTKWVRSLAADADSWADAIVREVGKPKGEALGEVVTSLDAIRWTTRHGGRTLAPETLGPGWQSILLIPKARVCYRPLGVVGMIGTWNYPLFLNAPAIAQAVAAGNAVVWKPSELAPLAGQRLQESLDNLGFPLGLVAIVQGQAEVGRALVSGGIDKGMFTGGIENGRRVLTALAEQGVPALAELSGFDPAIVLPDAPRASTVRSLTWGAFVGCGQACVAVKRIYVVGDARPWIDELAASSRSLRIGDPAAPEVDLGPLISEDARERFDQFVRATVNRGARIVAGASRGLGQVGFILRRYSRPIRPSPRPRSLVSSARSFSSARFATSRRRSPRQTRADLASLPASGVATDLSHVRSPADSMLGRSPSTMRSPRSATPPPRLEGPRRAASAGSTGLTGSASSRSLKSSRRGGPAG